jgi:hypothetical protein
MKKSGAELFNQGITLHSRDRFGGLIHRRTARDPQAQQIPTARRQRKVRDRPQRNRQRFDDTPMATIDAASATENPARTRTNGRVMETKPLLMP